jgi:hypothetical protein
LIVIWLINFIEQLTAVGTGNDAALGAGPGRQRGAGVAAGRLRSDVRSRSQLTPPTGWPSPTHRFSNRPPLIEAKDETLDHFPIFFNQKMYLNEKQNFPLP